MQVVYEIYHGLASAFIDGTAKDTGLHPDFMPKIGKVRVLRGHACARGPH